MIVEQMFMLYNTKNMFQLPIFKRYINFFIKRYKE